MSLGVCLATTTTAQAAKPTLDECINANDKGASLRASGKLQDARSQFAACAAPGCPKDIRNECEEQLKATNAAVPTVIFEAKDGAGRDLEAVHVTVDGKLLTKALDGTPLEFDPGAHQFSFSCTGQPSLSRAFVLREGEKSRREPIVLGAPPPPISTAPLVTAPPGLITSTMAPKSDAEAPTKHGMRTTTILGITAGAVGLVSLGVGSAFGLMTRSAIQKQKTDCPDTATCSPTGHALALTDHSNMTTDSTISIVTFAAGGALLATGAVLLLLPDHRSETSTTAHMRLVPTVTPGSGGLLLHGEF